MLADRGISVTGIDPARAYVDVAREKPSAARVRWLAGDAGDLPSLRVGLTRVCVCPEFVPPRRVHAAAVPRL